jgi:hypothetical protein
VVHGHERVSFDRERCLLKDIEFGMDHWHRFASATSAVIRRARLCLGRWDRGNGNPPPDPALLKNTSHSVEVKALRK